MTAPRLAERAFRHKNSAERSLRRYYADRFDAYPLTTPINGLEPEPSDFKLGQKVALQSAESW
jgi:hypothetical protein